MVIKSLQWWPLWLRTVVNRVLTARSVVPPPPTLFSCMVVDETRTTIQSALVKCRCALWTRGCSQWLSGGSGSHNA
ncbi:hypothetical protein CLF_113198 [Clonorchis sinensis]|uniref:Secreted protein n=1 Tax=Clonorchis sinensis TaxID=79923 RepID=G7YXV9_CLOSI|nr:hypothetical protein CLF_113198 [Clonorchis sinensis]